jgi:type I restriction enzyme M protein
MDESLADRILDTARDVEERNTAVAGVFTRGLLSGLRVLPPAELSQLLLNATRVNFFDIFAEHPFGFAQWIDLRVSEIDRTIDPPPFLTGLVAALASVEPARSITDPACGHGTLLVGTAIALAEYLDTEDGNSGADFEIRGQEITAVGWALTRFRLCAHGFVEPAVEFGDTLRDPKLLTESGELARTDLMICAPPWRRRLPETTGADPWERFDYGALARNASEAAFVHHAIACMPTKGGRAIIVLPRGFLSRGGGDAQLRQNLVDRGLLDAVFATSEGRKPLQWAVLVLDSREESRARRETLFVDVPPTALESPDDHGAHRPLIKELAEAAYQKRTSSNFFSASIAQDEIVSNAFMLDPRFYQPATTTTRKSVDELVRELEESSSELSACTKSYDAALSAAMKLLEKE